jgi:phospholipid/cholesterol/gamma-HCH transport system ATP-binding protein
MAHPDHGSRLKAVDAAGGHAEVIISVRDLVVGFGQRTVMNKLCLDVFRGEILGFVGASGSGKSVLMRTILGLVPKRSGTITAFNQTLDQLTPLERSMLERRWGVLFQHGALFSSLTVLQNIQVPMREYLHLSQGTFRRYGQAGCFGARFGA